MNLIEDHQRLKSVCFILEQDLNRAHQRNELLQSLVLDLREKLEEEILSRELIEKYLDFHKDSLLEKNREIKTHESAVIASHQDVQMLRDSNIEKEVLIRALYQCIGELDVDQHLAKGTISKKRKTCV